MENFPTFADKLVDFSPLALGTLVSEIDRFDEVSP